MYRNICKSCGGELERRGNHFYCPYCGSKWNIDADSDVHTIDRANAWAALRDGDFEKAVELFENILLKEKKSHEAHWGIALAKAGILYVTDLNEAKRVPTCNNISEESFNASRDVKEAIALAPAEIRESYIEQAKIIEAIRVEWLEKARKEPEYDVFICFKDSDRENGIERTKDSYDAQELFYQLKEAGYRVFFSRESLRDKISEQYEPYIYNALKTAKVMIVFGEKSEYFSAVWVKNEWMRFRKMIEKGEKHQKALVIAYKDINPGDLPAGLRSRQCLNAGGMSFIPDLLRHVKIVVESSKSGPTIDRVEITGGEIGAKASKIENATISTREIGSGAKAETEITLVQQLGLVRSYIKGKMWEDAQNTVETILFNDPNFAEAILLELLIRYNVVSKADLLDQAGFFTSDDLRLFEKIINYSGKEQAAEMLDDLYSVCPQQNEKQCLTILKMILPYNYDSRDVRIKECFKMAIQKGYFEVFKALISTLKSDEVDRYISYHMDYARQTLDADQESECLNAVIKVDAGNIEALWAKFELDWKDAELPALIGAFENILKYSKEPQAVVQWAFKLTVVTETHCQFMKSVLRYYSGEVSKIAVKLVDIGEKMVTEGFFDEARYFVELAVASGYTEPEVYWLTCLIELRAKNQSEIYESDISIKSIPEYTKYLTVVSEDKRQECFEIASRQANAIRMRENHKKQVAEEAEDIAAKERKKRTSRGVRMTITALMGIALIYLAIFVGFKNQGWIWVKESLLPKVDFSSGFGSVAIIGICILPALIVGFLILIKITKKAQKDYWCGDDVGNCCGGLFVGYIAGGILAAVIFGVVRCLIFGFGWLMVGAMTMYSPPAIALVTIIPILIIGRKAKTAGERLFITFLVLLMLAVGYLGFVTGLDVIEAAKIAAL